MCYCQIFIFFSASQFDVMRQKIVDIFTKQSVWKNVSLWPVHFGLQMIKESIETFGRHSNLATPTVQIFSSDKYQLA